MLTNLLTGTLFSFMVLLTGGSLLIWGEKLADDRNPVMIAGDLNDVA